MSRRYKKIHLSPETVLGLIEAPEGTTATWAVGAFDPPGVTIILENPRWPSVPDDQECPYLQLRADVQAGEDGVRRVRLSIIDEDEESKK